MTCAVGVKVDGRVYMGVDSIVCCGNTYFENALKKMFRHGDLLVSCAGEFRVPNVIEHCIEPPKWPKKMTAEKYLAKRWIPAIRAGLIEAGAIPESPSPTNDTFELLVGAPGRLFVVGCDLSFTEVRRYGAIGIGEPIAQGAMGAYFDAIARGLYIPPEEIVVGALAAAQAHCQGVSAPFFTDCV
jgi:ATP-dependent protease HslVU (ClpYQ) peptidase subunit